MVKIKELVTLLLMIMHFRVIISSGEVSQNSILERLDSIEAVQELHGLKIEQVETLFTGLKGRVDRLEIRDKEILEDLEKLDRKIADISSSVSSLSSSKISDQRLQSNNGLQFELNGDDITKYAAINGGPSSCQDLRMIGHSLDGFYTIRSNATLMKTIYCDFYGKIVNKINPTTTVPSTTILKAGSDFKVVRVLDLKHTEGKSYPLMNKHGKCLAVETTGKIKPSEKGAKIVQSTCNPTEKGQLWKFDRLRKILCNDWKKCLSEPFGDVHQWELSSGETNEIWMGSAGKIECFGYCLSLEDNSNADGVKAIWDNCNNKESQSWSFAQY